MMQYAYELILAGKVISLLFGIAYTFGNIGRLSYGKAMSGYQIYIMAAGITGFVTLQWLI
jgi:hypothetical protein